MDTLLYSVLSSGDFHISLNYNWKEVQVFWCTKKAVANMLKERRPVQPLQIYPVMLWSKFSSLPICMVSVASKNVTLTNIKYFAVMEF